MNNLIRAAALAGYEALAQACGLDPAPALKRVGLSSDALADADALISYRAMIDLLEHSAQACGQPGFGLNLAQRQGLEVLGALAVVVEHAPTLGEAMALAARYVHVQSPALQLEVQAVAQQPDLLDLVFRIELPEVRAKAQATELGLGLIVRCIGLVSGGHDELVAVLLPHERLGSAAGYRELFGVQCLFRQAHAAVRLRAQDLTRPLPHSNELLRRLAQNYLDTQFTRPEQGLDDQVRQLIGRYLGTGKATQNDISRMLALHPRTLQRRLADQGLRFEDIKDQVRRELFQRWLAANDGPPLATLAGMLDYAEPSALTRSCRRWFGLSPTQLKTQWREPQTSAG